MIHSLYGSEELQKQVLESTTGILDIGIKEFDALKRYYPILELAMSVLNKSCTSKKIYEVCKKFMKDLTAREKLLFQVKEALNN